jgi:hypothetical protein
MYYKKPKPEEPEEERINTNAVEDDAEFETYMELAQPYWNFQTQRQTDRNHKMKTADSHNMLEPSIADDQTCFNTKAWLIRYCEEEIELNDIVMFRAELFVEPHYLSTEFYLDVELMFCDLSSLGGPTGWKNNYKKYESQAVFKPAQTQTYKMMRLPSGICEFVPVNF